MSFLSWTRAPSFHPKILEDFDTDLTSQGYKSTSMTLKTLAH